MTKTSKQNITKCEILDYLLFILIPGLKIYIVTSGIDLYTVALIFFNEYNFKAMGSKIANNIDARGKKASLLFSV